jgi:TPR repeat protein
MTDKACKGGHAQGCHHLGFMLTKGLGREKVHCAR